MKISIIIPNYNGEELLRKNLPKVVEAAEEYKDGSVEIIIVDDGSIDNSIHEIKNQSFGFAQDKKSRIKNNDIELRLYQNEKNLGFSSTINRGVREANGEVVVLLNTDVAPEKEFLEPLLKNFEDRKVFAVGCMDKSVENGKTVLRGRGIGKWERGFLVHSRGEVDKTDTLWVNGGSGAFRKSIWNKLGGFNELYNPFYWEDIDLSYRALKSGYKVVFEPKSIVIHEHEKGVIQQKCTAFQIKTIAYRNQFIFVWGNLTDIDLKLSHLFWLPYFLCKALVKKDWPLFLGFLKAFILIPRIIRSSFVLQRSFIKSDKKVMKEKLK